LKQDEISLSKAMFTKLGL